MNCYVEMIYIKLLCKTSFEIMTNKNEEKHNAMLNTNQKEHLNVYICIEMRMLYAHYTQDKSDKYKSWNVTHHHNIS